VPTFNRSALLSRALGSVLAQTYPNFELLVSDNNSTDDTQAVAMGYASRDRRVHVLPSPPPNTPAMHNIRHVLQAATGKYAVVLADDDYLLDFRYLESGVQMLEANGVGLLVTDCVLGRPRREATHLNLPPVTPGREYFFGFWRGRYQVPVISNLFDLEMARRCEPWNDPNVLYADVELWLKMMTMTDVAYYHYPAVYYHFHGQNIVSTVSLAMHMENVRFIDNAARFAAEVFGHEAVREWKKSMLVEYWRTVIEEGHRWRLRDLAAMRSAIGLQDEPLGWQRWRRTAKYISRYYRRAAKAYLRRKTRGEGRETRGEAKAAADPLLPVPAALSRVTSP
jgi:glycosyltransferase involved in cell wall biosynthesis